jgi:hypothetical protein
MFRENGIKLSISTPNWKQEMIFRTVLTFSFSSGYKSFLKECENSLDFLRPIAPAFSFEQVCFIRASLRLFIYTLGLLRITRNADSRS